MSQHQISDLISAQKRLDEALERFSAALEQLADICEEHDCDDDEQMAAEA